MLYDAHNHVQDDRIRPFRRDLIEQTVEAGVTRMVVNGTRERDWQAVLELANTYPELVVPSFGYHPWHVRERTADWQDRLVAFLDQTPSTVGEIGLDRWVKDHNIRDQEEVFVWQLRLAAERNLPVSIHCLKAWGLLHDILRREPVPKCGFLLHSYGGPVEMVEPLSVLGAYFSFPGYFAHERKTRQREVFKQVPRERLLIETDAPDQCLPPSLDQWSLTDPDTGKPLNHPANLTAVYACAAGLLGEPLDSLVAQVQANFQRLFDMMR